MTKTKKPKAAKTKTLVTLLLDRTGSMSMHRAATISGVNEWLGGLRASKDDIRLSLVLFDHHMGKIDLEKVHVAARIADVPNITEENYIPRGMTPLIDAAYTTIKAVEESLVGKEGVKVVIAIQTDGDDNESRMYGWNQLRALIRDKEAMGWEFNFLGAGINAYSQGARMGLKESKIMSYGTDKSSTRSAFAASACNTVAYASGLVQNTEYSAAQKRQSGDAFFQGPADPGRITPLANFTSSMFPREPDFIDPTMMKSLRLDFTGPFSLKLNTAVADAEVKHEQA